MSRIALEVDGYGSFCYNCELRVVDPVNPVEDNGSGFMRNDWCSIFRQKLIKITVVDDVKAKIEMASLSCAGGYIAGSYTRCNKCIIAEEKLEEYLRENC